VEVEITEQKDDEIPVPRQKFSDGVWDP